MIEESNTYPLPSYVTVGIYVNIFLIPNPQHTPTTYIVQVELPTLTTVLVLALNNHFSIELDLLYTLRLKKIFIFENSQLSWLHILKVLCLAFPMIYITKNSVERFLRKSAKKIFFKIVILGHPVWYIFNDFEAI